MRAWYILASVSKNGGGSGISVRLRLSAVATLHLLRFAGRTLRVLIPHVLGHKKCEHGMYSLVKSKNGGGSGIRTHGNLRYGGFQDRCLKPDSTIPPLKKEKQ